jgi:hypothetical protein
MADEIVPIDDEDVAAGGSWMTIATLAQKRRITKASAWRLVTRRGWERLKGNDGAVRVYVPRGQQQPQTDVSRDDPIDSRDDPTDPTDSPNGGDAAMTGFTAALDALREAHQGHVTSMQAVIDGQAQVIATAEAKVEQLRQEVAQWRSAGWRQRRRLRRRLQP